MYCHSAISIDVDRDCIMSADPIWLVLHQCVGPQQQNISIVHLLISHISSCFNPYLSYLDSILQILKLLELNICRHSNMMWRVVLQGNFC